MRKRGLVTLPFLLLLRLLFVVVCLVFLLVSSIGNVLRLCTFFRSWDRRLLTFIIFWSLTETKGFIIYLKVRHINNFLQILSPPLKNRLASITLKVLMVFRRNYCSHLILYTYFTAKIKIFTLSMWTYIPMKTVLNRNKLLLNKQFEQGRHYLPFI